MKKLCLMFTICIGFCMAQASFAKAASTGIYVAPKFIYGYAVQDGQKGHITLRGTDNANVSNNFGSDGDSTAGGALAVGYNFDKQFNIPVRAELEYAAFGSVTAKGNTNRVIDATETLRSSLKQESQIQTLLLNAYYDIKTGTDFTPYVGAGIGIGFVDAKSKGRVRLIDSATPGDDFNLNFSSSRNLNTNFAWNVGAGLGWDATDFLAVDLGYRFVGLGEVKGNSTTITDGSDSLTLRSRVRDMYMHQVMLGLRFTF